jgi:F0F1-type ATP synthase assembly protein I
MSKPQDPREMLRYTSVGMEFIAAFAMGLVVGYWADWRWDTSPLWTLVGSAVGFAAGIYRIVRVAGEIRERMKDNDKHGH